MARGWPAVSEILVRSVEGEAGAFGHLLLLEGGKGLGIELPAVGRDGEILLESADRASGYFTTHSDAPASVKARTAGVYWRAVPEDMSILDGGDDRQRAELIAERLRQWKSIANA